MLNLAELKESAQQRILAVLAEEGIELHNDPTTPKAEEARPAEKGERELIKRAFEQRYIIAEHHLSPETVFKRMGQLALKLQGQSTDCGALCQSSGWGKSRLMAEVAKRHFCLYISFMPRSNTGYPSRTASAKVLNKTLTSSTNLDDVIASGRALLANMVRAITEFQGSPAEWFNHQVHSTQAPTLDQPSVIEKANQLLKFAVEQFQKIKKEPYLLVLVDEAGELLRDSEISGFSRFRLIRRICARSGITALFASTNSKVQNFAPSARQERSLRTSLRGEEFALPPPICAVGPVDWAAKNYSAASFEETLSEIHMARFGRYLWWATYQARKSLPNTNCENALKALASHKLFSPNVPSVSPSPEILLAAACTCTALRIGPNVEIAEQLVSSHMATLCHVDSNRELLYITYASEPLLANAALDVLRRDPRGVISQILSAIYRGLSNRGNAGELAVRLASLLHPAKTVETLECSMFPHRTPSDGKTCGFLTFNHWMRSTSRTLGVLDILEGLRRRAAIIPLDSTQRAFDLVIPAFYGSPDSPITLTALGGIFIQIKNRQQAPASATTLVEAMREQVESQFPELDIRNCKFWVLARKLKRTDRQASGVGLIEQTFPLEIRDMVETILMADLDYEILFDAKKRVWKDNEVKFEEAFCRTVSGLGKCEAEPTRKRQKRRR